MHVGLERLTATPDEDIILRKIQFTDQSFVSGNTTNHLLKKPPCPQVAFYDALGIFVLASFC